MKKSLRVSSGLLCLAAAAASLSMLASVDWALAEEPATIQVTIRDHQFTPAEIHVQAGKPAILVITNEDATAEEFDSSALKTEKVIAAKTQGMVRLRALSPGRFPFKGEFHPTTAQGVVVAE